jgi:hypothetical protein
MTSIAPVLWWKGENNAIESQNGVNASWLITPAYEVGQVGQAFKLLMSNPGIDYNVIALTVVNNPLFNFLPTGNFSIRFWIKVNSSASNFVPIIKGNFPYGTSDWGIGFYAGGFQLIINGGTSNDVGSIPQNGTWHDILMTYDNGIWQFFVDSIDNGVAATYNGTKITNNIRDLFFGWCWVFGSFDGAIDEIRIYDQVILPSNIDPFNFPGKKITQKQLLGFKLETNPGTLETLTTTDYKYPIYDLKVILGIESYFQNVNTGDFSNLPSIAGKRSCAVNFKVDVYAMTSLITAPPYFDIIKACGWKQAIHGTSGISIRPNSLYNRVMATMEAVYEDDGVEPRQLVYKISGAMGMIKIIGSVGSPLTLEFSFIGALEEIITRTYVDRIQATTFNDIVPLPLMGAIAQIFNTDTAFQTIEINSNEVINLFSNINRRHGYDGARVADRLINGTLEVILSADEVALIQSRIENSITGALLLNFGTITVKASAIQLINFDDHFYKLMIIFLNDDLQIWQGTDGSPDVIFDGVVEIEGNIELEGNVEL